MKVSGRFAAVLVAATLVVAATGGVVAAGSGKSDSEVVAAAKKRLKQHYAGTDRDLPTSAPAPQPGQNVWVIPCAVAAEGCNIPAQAIEDAGDRIGWDVTIFDGEFAPPIQSNGVRAAIADGADAIVLIAVDCASVEESLQEAKDAGIVIYGDFSLDCNEGTDGPQLFDANAVLSPTVQSYSDYLATTRARAVVDWVIAKAGAQAKILIADQTDLINAQIEKEGIENRFAKVCPKCEISTVEFTADELLGGSLAGVVATALTQDPDVDVVLAPYDASITLGIGPGVEQSGVDVLVVGYEGLSANMAEIKAGGPTSVATGFPSQWVGWQTVDELNRIFNGEELVDQGMGYQVVDKQHNIPTKSDFYDGNVDSKGKPRQNYQANFLKLWGVS